jgi:glucose-6-phosphate dehydrogenase assembly protein OpcA
MKVKLDTVEKELAKLWESQAASAHSARVELFTIVAIVSDPKLLARTNDVLARVVRAQACRTIVALPVDGATPQITADIALHKNPERKNEACGDAIVLEATGPARAWLPGNIERLLLADVPACVWWVGDLPDHDDLFDKMVRRADVVLVNSSEMDLRDLEKLSQIAQGSKDSYAFMDLTWVRLRRLQDLVARFFDDPPVRPLLDTLTRITFAYSPKEGDTDVASTRAGLLLGWMGFALGLVPESAKWKTDDRGGEVTLDREGGRPKVTVRFDRDSRPNVHDGAITRIELVSDAGNGAQAKFEIARQEDPLTVKWSCNVPGIAVPDQVLRVGAHEEAQLLARSLERPTRDRLLDASLLVASRIVRSVAPRLSERPPRSA